MPSRYQKVRRRAAAAPPPEPKMRVDMRDLPDGIDMEITNRILEPERVVKRKLIAHMGLHCICERHGCRRNRRCMHPRFVPCWGENNRLIREELGPPLRALRKKRDAAQRNAPPAEALG